MEETTKRGTSKVLASAIEATYACSMDEIQEQNNVIELEVNQKEKQDKDREY